MGSVTRLSYPVPYHTGAILPSLFVHFPLFILFFLCSFFPFSCQISPSWHTCRFGIYSISDSLNAGLDLEMPGTNKWRTLDLVNRSIVARKITTRTMKKRAENVVELARKCAEGAPEVSHCPSSLKLEISFAPSDFPSLLLFILVYYLISLVLFLSIGS
jgi:hypothetical protein